MPASQRDTGKRDTGAESHAGNPPMVNKKDRPRPPPAWAVGHMTRTRAGAQAEKHQAALTHFGILDMKSPRPERKNGQGDVPGTDERSRFSHRRGGGWLFDVAALGRLQRLRLEVSRTKERSNPPC
jgi:hypothetical protein